MQQASWPPPANLIESRAKVRRRSLLAVATIFGAFLIGGAGLVAGLLLARSPGTPTHKTEASPVAPDRSALNSPDPRDETRVAQGTSEAENEHFDIQIHISYEFNIYSSYLQLARLIPWRSKLSQHRTYRILAQLDNRVYEAVQLDGMGQPMGDNIILKTSFMTFTSTGRASLITEITGTQQVLLQSGFTSKYAIHQESLTPAGDRPLSATEAREAMKSLEAKIAEAERVAVVAMLDAKPVYTNWKELAADIGVSAQQGNLNVFVLNVMSDGYKQWKYQGVDAFAASTKDAEFIALVKRR